MQDATLIITHRGRDTNGNHNFELFKNKKMKKIIFAFLILPSIKSKAQKTDADFSTVVTKESKLPENYITLKVNPERQFKENLMLANEGNKKAMYETAKNYKYGNGVIPDNIVALKWLSKAADANYGPANFTMGELYKFGDLVEMDYQKSFACFSKAADSGYIPAFYSKGYMLHKGLGCTQDYIQALSFFRKGAYNKYPPAMYMLGVTYRNGLGITTNADSAKYWLTIAASKGYKYAADELTTVSPENNPSAVELIKNIEDAKQNVAPTANPVNQYTKIATGVPADEIEGSYDGYLIKYDWSGKHIIDVSSLAVQIKYEGGKITGVWSENDSSINIPLAALLTKKGLLFQDMKYLKADHYSMGYKLPYKFQNATLQLTKFNNTFYLSGNLNLYNLNTKEPEKPLSIALIRKIKGNNNAEISFVNDDGSIIKSKDNLTVYPNPFQNIINVEFNLKKKTNVFTQLLTLDGKVVLTTPSLVLTPGKYMLPMQPNVPAGAYIVRLITGNKIQSVKLVKIQ
jgi:uncharacterized protein